jgi:pimeloyl-ACP methyl ester carboxylesterase
MSVIDQSAAQLNAVVLGKASAATPPLLILHGWGQDLEAMRPLGERLAWHRQVHLLDLPGFGRSPWSGENWDTRDYARCVLAYLDHVGLAQIDLLGHSFGGRIGLRVASEWPARLHRLVLMNAAGLPRRRTLQQRLRVWAIRTLGRGFRLLPATWSTTLLAWHRQRYGSRDYQSAGVLRGTFVKVVNEDQTANAARIKAPTLVLWGGRDQETPVEMAQRFGRLIPHAEVVVLPEQDHFPFAGSGVHACTQIIGDFLLASAPLPNQD